MIDLKKFPYENIRPTQLNVIERLNTVWDDPKIKYIVAQLPTGFGKSALAKTILSSHRHGFLITATKQLQDQYTQDFPTNDIRSIKGKANYKCSYNDKLNCEVGPCMVNKDILRECKLNALCPYYNARERALRANTALTSYQYFLRATECAGFWKQREILILDECHLLEQQITQWASIFLSPLDLHTQYDIFSDVSPDKFMVLTVAPDESGYEKNKIWLRNIFDLVTRKRINLYKDLEVSLGCTNPDDITEEELEELATNHKDYYDIDKLYKRLTVFFEAKDKNQWIIEPHENGVILQPINTGNLFHKYVDKWASDKIVFMSATILDINGFCEEVGLPKDRTAVIKIDSEFPPENSPIIYRPVGGKMNYANIDNTIPKIIEEVKQILKAHPNEKGIIHAGNYKITKAIIDNINNERLIMKDDNCSNEKLLDKHIKSKNATVLVSPSLTTGADLKDDLSRFQIFVKMPFGSLADKRVKKKMQFNDSWYVAEMFRTLVQACGRSTRSENDWSVTYILDNSFYYWVFQYKKWFSNQFLKRIIWKKEQFNLSEFKKKIKY